MKLFKKKKLNVDGVVATIVNWYTLFYTVIYGLFVTLAPFRKTLVNLVIAALPFISGWFGWWYRGYKLKSNPLYGFKILTTIMSYEIDLGDPNIYTLTYAKDVEALFDYLRVYPINYFWSGAGEEYPPTAIGKNQYLLSRTPYIETDGSKEWHYFFIILNPAIHSTQTATIEYKQKFKDTSIKAEPFLEYYAATNLEKLTLRVKFKQKIHPEQLKATKYSLFKPDKVFAVKEIIGIVDGWYVLTIDNYKKDWMYKLKWSP